MIKAIILDKGYRSKNVVVKFKGNYMCVSFAYFLNSLCRRHISDYQVRTAHFEDISNEATIEWFEILYNMRRRPAVQSCKEFENLWMSYGVVNGVVSGIDLY